MVGRNLAGMSLRGQDKSRLGDCGSEVPAGHTGELSGSLDIRKEGAGLEPETQTRTESCFRKITGSCRSDSFIC